MTATPAAKTNAHAITALRRCPRSASAPVLVGHKDSAVSARRMHPPITLAHCQGVLSANHVRMPQAKKTASQGARSNPASARNASDRAAIALPALDNPPPLCHRRGCPAFSKSSGSLPPALRPLVAVSPIGMIGVSATGPLPPFSGSAGRCN